MSDTGTSLITTWLFWISMLLIWNSYILEKKLDKIIENTTPTQITQEK